MLNWIKEVVVCSVAADEIETEDFQLGAELALPPELLAFLSEKSKSNHRVATRMAYRKDFSRLDEHESALS